MYQITSYTHLTINVKEHNLNFLMKISFTIFFCCSFLHILLTIKNDLVPRNILCHFFNRNNVNGIPSHTLTHVFFLFLTYVTLAAGKSDFRCSFFFICIYMHKCDFRYISSHRTDMSSTCSRYLTIKGRLRSHFSNRNSEKFQHCFKLKKEELLEMPFRCGFFWRRQKKFESSSKWVSWCW